MTSVSQPAEDQSVDNAALLNLLMSLQGNSGQGSSSSALGQPASSGRVETPELTVNFTNLPVDISEGYARRCQELVEHVGNAWFAKGESIAIEFVVKPRDPATHGDSRKILCNSQSSLEEALQDIDPNKTLVLVIIHSSLSGKSGNRSSGPKCTLRAMMTLCKHFKVLPTFTGPLEGQPALWAHVLPVERALEHNGLVSVLGYKAAFPWSSPDSELNHESMQINLFGTASYLSIDADGLQNLAIFSNLADPMVEPVREKWEESLQLSSINTRSALLPHFTMIGISLHQLMDVVKYQEFMQGTLIEQRFEIHAKTNSANVRTTIYQSKQYLKELIFYRYALNGLNSLINGLDEEIDDLTVVRRPDIFQDLKGKSASREVSDAGALLDKQIGKWKRTLLRQVEMCRSRINDLIEIQRANEGLMLSFMAQRDSASQAKNTAQIASLAKVTESSGQEIKDMTRRMEIDAKTMRSLAEITAVFLPLTAIATFFSMDFLSITSDAGPVPGMSNLRYFWVYAVALFATCGFVFGWWWYSNRSRTIKQVAEPIADVEAVENVMELQATAEVTRRKEYGRRKFEEAKAEWDEWKAKKARGEPVPDNTIYMIKLFAARQAMETGEDFDELIAAGTESM